MVLRFVFAKEKVIIVKNSLPMFQSNFIQKWMEKAKRNMNILFIAQKITPIQVLTEEIQYAFHFYISGAFKRLQ